MPQPARGQQDKPRLLAVEAAMDELGGEAAEETEGCLPFAPFPLRLSRSTLAAPKLSLRAKGDCGIKGLEEDVPDGGPASSSKGLSSTEFEFALEMLSARPLIVPNGEVWAPGRVERPRVVMDRRRPPPLGCAGRAARLLNMSTNDERRRRGDGGESFGLELSEDMVNGARGNGLSPERLDLKGGWKRRVFEYRSAACYIVSTSRWGEDVMSRKAAARGGGAHGPPGNDQWRFLSTKTGSSHLLKER